MRVQRTWLGLALLVLVNIAGAAADPCAVCGKEIEDTVTTWEDKVSHVKRRLCKKCTELPDNCFVCSLPLLLNYKTLPDGRTICERDASTVVLDDEEAAKICEQVRTDLERQFVRFITFPNTNVTLELMDRVAIQQIYKFAGNDCACPNMWGCTRTKTNQISVNFQISLLSGLPRELLTTTCVHEYAHTWIIENVPPARAEKIGADGVEGFCELLAYLYAEQQGSAVGTSNILANYYTRGQIQLFIAAHHRYGFEDIIDWMKSGEDPLLLRDDLSRLRRLEERPKINLAGTNIPAAKAGIATPNPPLKPRERLVLQGITWSRTQPLAIINDQTFGAMHRARVRLAGTNFLIRCLEIRTNSVLIEYEDRGVKQELFLLEK